MRYLFVFLLSLSLMLGIFSAPSSATQKNVPPGQAKKNENGTKTSANIVSPKQKDIPPGQQKKMENGVKVAAKPKNIPPGQQKQIENRIKNRIKKLSAAQKKAQVKNLNAKLKRVKIKYKAAKPARARALLETEIWRIEREIHLLSASTVVVKTPPPGPPIIPPGHIRYIPPPPAPLPMPKPKVVKPRSPQFGISAGYIGGIPGARAEMKFLDPFDLVSTSIRLGVGYAEGEDSDGINRKHALVVLDGMYHLNPPHTKGIRSYLGLGINYDAYTTGKVSGDLGASAFYGIEGGPVNGLQMFFELGYGSIRTGFSPDYTGLSALLGVKF